MVTISGGDVRRWLEEQAGRWVEHGPQRAPLPPGVESFGVQAVAGEATLMFYARWPGGEVETIRVTPPATR